MIIPLSRKYPSIFGVPVLDRFDSEIFRFSSVSDCMNCRFCEDSCCFYGVDVDLLNYQRILEHAERIEQFSGLKAADFFGPIFHPDPEFPGGSYVRTNTVNKKCVFLKSKPGERGCFLHDYCLRNHLDYHQLKPMVSTLFPLTFDEGLLHAMDEVEDATLVCLDQGKPIFRTARAELRYYFGEELVTELDSHERVWLESRNPV